MEAILREFADYGIIGLLLAWLFWKDWKVTIRTFQVIENNTKALTELKESLKNKR
jgi:hypothetical protein